MTMTERWFCGVLPPSPNPRKEKPVAKVKNPASLIDEIAASIPESHSGWPWWKRLDESQRELTQPILAAWRSGKFGNAKMPAARAIATKLREHGIKIGAQGVLAWLQRGE